MSDDIPELRGTWWARLICWLVGCKFRDLGDGRYHCVRCHFEVRKL